MEFTEKNIKEVRNINCDLMRVVCMVFVIAIHTPVKPMQDKIWFATSLNTFLFMCNGIFYMLSGRFNLCYKFTVKKDYSNFYKKKAISILLPYIMVTCLLSLWDVMLYWEKDRIGIKSYLIYTYEAFMSANEMNHLWFMYPLIGLMISTPFLAKMLQGLKDWELNLIFIIALIWNFVSIYLTKDVGISFSYSGWLWSGWPLLFFLGYYCHRIINDRNKKILYIVGIMGFMVSVLGQILFGDHYQNSRDQAVAFIIFTMAAYTFMEKEIVIRNKYVIRIISLVSKYSFLIYMLHNDIIHRITTKMVTTELSVCYFAETIILTLLISIVMAILLEKCIIHPAQTILRKCLR